jgi:FemAB-related protein (PEP-CTERM system-associated)
MAIRELRKGDEAAWDDYVAANPAATFFHLSGWKSVLESATPHRPRYLLSESSGKINGVLPLAHVRSLLFGSSLISTPFCVYGGAIADDEGARRALEDAAAQMARQLGVGYLEMRNLTPCREDWPRKSLYVTFRRPISSNDEENLNAIPRKQRAVVRKGIQLGMQGVVDADERRLYDIYSESVRNLGTPVFSRRYLQCVYETFRSRSEILTVEHEGRGVASVLSFFFRDEVLPYYGGSIAEARNLYANDFMYWDVMRRAAARGVRVFDYGRSKRETGSYRFKKHWGFEETPLAYEYSLVRAQAIPDLSPANSKYGIMVQAWKKLPLPVSRAIGPWIARNLG